MDVMIIVHSSEKNNEIYRIQKKWLDDVFVHKNFLNN